MTKHLRRRIRERSSALATLWQAGFVPGRWVFSYIGPAEVLGHPFFGKLDMPTVLVRLPVVGPSLMPTLSLVPIERSPLDVRVGATL